MLGFFNMVKMKARLHNILQHPSSALNHQSYRKDLKTPCCAE